MLSRFYQRYSVRILIAILAAVPVLLFGALNAFQSDGNNVRQWLPRGFEETRHYDWFLKHFGSEEMAVVSWPGLELGDERVERLAAALSPGDAETAGPYSRYFKRVVTGEALLKQLTDKPLELSEAEARIRLQGVLVGPDGEASGLVVMVSDEGAQNRHAALDTIYAAAQDIAGIAPDQLRVGGPTVDSVALDRESARSRYYLAALSVVFALFLAWRCLRRVQLVAIVFATALLAALTAVATVYFTGHKMSLVLVTMPTLIYVLAISGAIHLANYYRDELEHSSPEEAPARAVHAAWLPCVLAAGTTAVGLGSLGFSQVVPVKLFGIYSALGVLTTLPFLFFFLPAALICWPIRAVERTASERSPLLILNPHHWTRHLANVTTRRHGLVTAACMLLMAVAGLGVLRLETSVRLLNLFSPKARIIQDYRWLERNLGPLVPVEVVLRMDEQVPLSFLQRVEMVGEVQQRLDELEHVGGTLSAATFSPEVPRGGGMQQIIYRRLAEKKLEQNREQLSESQLVRDTDDGQLWRISARVDALGNVDYGQFIEHLEQAVQPVLDDYAARGVEVDAVYTGVVPLVYKAQRELLSDLTESFIAAFLLIGMLMVLMLRKFLGGMLTMLPNVFPALTVFGMMGWSGLLCDIGSMMTASVALGIAVDDTIHFLSWFRRGLQQGMSRSEAVKLAYQSCAGAMIQTTIVCGLGLLVFGFSSFVPTSRFAMLMFTMLVTALVGDLLFLPAMLAGPLGRFFEQRNRPQPAGKAWIRRAVRTVRPTLVGVGE